MLWNEMLADFRALGGTAENVYLAEGPLGRGLFPINSSRPVRLHVPESLLLPTHFVEFENGTFRMGTNAPLDPRGRTFIEAYEREFSWGVSRRETEELLTLLQEATTALRQILETPFEAHAWLAGAEPQTIAERFFAARALPYKGIRVVAPVLDLINHGLGPRFQATNGIALQGQFQGEVVIRYGPTDPLGIFNGWGFASPCEFFALSLGLRLKTNSGSLVIGRQDAAFGGTRNPFVPEISISGDTITLSNLLLGHKSIPKLARGIFYRIMREAGRPDAEETFDRIQHINRMAYHKLESDAENAAPPLGRVLRDLARYELELMSYNIGASEALQA